MDRETWDKTHTSGSGDPDTEKERNFRESAQTGTGPYGNGEGFVSSESDGEARSGAEGDLRKGSAEGRADTGSAGGEAEVDYSIASGLREEVKSQRSTFAWNSKNSSENESTDGIQGSSFAGRKILKQRTAGNLTIFPGIQIHGQIMLRRKKAQIFSGARDPLIRKIRISSDSRTVNVRRNRRSL